MMAKKKQKEKHAAQVSATQGVEGEAADVRPTSSPYASPMIRLCFGDGQPLYVPSALLYKAPKLSCCWGPDKIIHLVDVPSDAGHVLVHYLYTGQYQSLKPTGTSSYDRSIAEFATSVRVYGISQFYDLGSLETLTQSEMRRLGQELEVMKALEVVKDLHPTLAADDKWLRNYLKSLLGKLVDMPPEYTSSVSSTTPNPTLPIFNVLLGVMVDLHHERMGSSQRNTESTLACDGHSHGQEVGDPEATVVASPRSELAYTPKLTPRDSPEEVNFVESIPSTAKGKNKEEEDNRTDWEPRSEVADEAKALIDTDSAPESVTSLNEKIWQCVEEVHQINTPLQDLAQGPCRTSHESIPSRRLEPDIDFDLRVLGIPRTPSPKAEVEARPSFDKSDDASRLTRKPEPLLRSHTENDLSSISRKEAEEDQISPSPISSKGLLRTPPARSQTSTSGIPTSASCSSSSQATPAKASPLAPAAQAGRSSAPKPGIKFSAWLKDVNQIPSTLGSYGRRPDAPGPEGAERFEHICAQDKFRGFSPEELRWKHELVKRILG